MILYIASHKTGEFLGTREATKDIKNPDRFVIPPYQTPTALPDDAVLEDNEYWAYLDESSKPVRDYRNGTWVKKERQVKVTAYLKADCTKQKEFDDKTLVTDDYTLDVPKTRFDEWIDNAWVTNLQNQYQAQVQQVTNRRAYLYLDVDRLRSEATSVLEIEGDEAKAEEYRLQANALYLKIRSDNPWPTPPEA
ncbi:hypothetical protein [Vibrio sp. V08_P9A1T1]|uniref:hypothetical protein n=1 Tax=Vibrio sp. V08_P9A1T1 TaxID=1938663 RepID=UPI000B8EBA32|nr:hypothetical protein [Vibrio sp. V08_P9A1T1]OXX22072.1 hypothetical protein B9J92_14970 [Vibrio sp. V08_P9A1T1]